VAGRGPAPKPADRRARTNRSDTPVTVLRFEPGKQPSLPDDFPWPDRTRNWWAAWQRSPYAEHIDEMGWHELLAAALLHADVWGNYNLDRLPELRIRVAKFGITMEDRARLRIQFADADDADKGAGATKKAATAREKFADIHVIHGEDGQTVADTAPTAVPARAPRAPRKKT
jgi:hypothetical protein